MTLSGRSRTPAHCNGCFASYIFLLRGLESWGFGENWIVVIFFFFFFSPCAHFFVAPVKATLVSCHCMWTGWKWIRGRYRFRSHCTCMRVGVGNFRGKKFRRIRALKVSATAAHLLWSAESVWREAGWRHRRMSLSLPLSLSPLAPYPVLA